MLLNAISHLLSLDFGFFIDLIMNNILLLFMFAALMFFFTEGKKFIIGTFVFTITVWAWLDLQGLGGISILLPVFLALSYLSKLFLLSLAEQSPRLKNKLYLINEISFIILLVAFTYLVLGK